MQLVGNERIVASAEMDSLGDDGHKHDHNNSNNGGDAEENEEESDDVILLSPTRWMMLSLFSLVSLTNGMS